MDYEIRPTNRKELRIYASFFRSIGGYSAEEAIDPIVLFDKLPDMDGFKDVRYEVVYNDVLKGNVPAQCIPSDDGYLIQIKESVYQGAYERKVGGHRMHIMHEIMHSYLDRVDRENHISYIRKDGTTVKYSKSTNEFAIIDKNGIVTTYYHPARGIYEYYKDRRNHK